MTCFNVCHLLFRTLDFLRSCLASKHNKEEMQLQKFRMLLILIFLYWKKNLKKWSLFIILLCDCKVKVPFINVIRLYKDMVEKMNHPEVISLQLHLGMICRHRLNASNLSCFDLGDELPRNTSITVLHSNLHKLPSYRQGDGIICVLGYPVLTNWVNFIVENISVL